ncbi:MAG: UDP-N-acetylmuramate dehydrogenase [Candidatus Omnitrophota bacterium]
MAGNQTRISSAADESAENALRRRFAGRLACGVPLAPYTTLKIGGPAQYLLEADACEQIIDARRLALDLEIPFYFLAGCSNVLIADAGLQGLVVINKTRRIEWGEDYAAWAAGGCGLDDFVMEASRRGWGDMTFAAGIPGSLGGALAGGAGAFGHLVCEYLLQADVLRKDGSLAALTTAELGVDYRDSQARRRGDIVLQAKMGPFVPSSPGDLLLETQRIKQERKEKHPGEDLPSAGSFFKNLPPAEPGGRRIPAGKYLDEAGAKQLRVGDAGVFPKHANIIVNHGRATAAQVNELADAMAARVKQRFGVILEKEVQYLC